MMSSGWFSRYVVIDVAAETMFKCVNMTPLGRPVEPDV